MNDEPIALEEWRQLFEAAIQFKKQASWEWMEDEDYFAVTDPYTGEIGYCVILGAGGMDYGLNVYLGQTAPLLLQEIRSANTFGADTREVMFNTKAIAVNFEDRNVLDKEDLSLIRELGYKFRGSREWPQFRNYSPGFYPWSLTRGEVRFLTVALEQAYEVAGRFRLNHELYFEHDEADEGVGEKRLHRVPRQTPEGVLWRDEWLPWHAEGSLIGPYTFPDELALHQCKKMKKSRDVWQSDFDFAEMTIGGRGERPFYPRLCIWIDGKTSMIISAQLAEQADCREEYVRQLIELLKTLNRKPARIEVGSVKAYYALKISAEQLGIPLRFHLRLDALLDAKDAINESF